MLSVIYLVLQLGHVLLSSCFLGERPGQHELRFKDCAGTFHSAIQCRSQPPHSGMPNLALNVRDHLSGIGLIPAPIEVLGVVTEDLNRRSMNRISTPSSASAVRRGAYWMAEVGYRRSLNRVHARRSPSVHAPATGLI